MEGSTPQYKQLPILWQADNKDFTVKLESCLKDIKKLKLIVYKRVEQDGKFVKTDEASFFFDPDMLVSILNIMEKAIKPIQLQFQTKSDKGERYLVINYVPNKSLAFLMSDKTVEEPFTGKIAFVLKINCKKISDKNVNYSAIPLQLIQFHELLNVVKKIELWYLMNRQEIFNVH